jgi:hypothetical protein
MITLKGERGMRPSRDGYIHHATIAWLKRMLDSGKHDPVLRQGLLKLLAEQAAQGDRNGWVSRL